MTVSYTAEAIQVVASLLTRPSVRPSVCLSCFFLYSS